MEGQFDEIKANLAPYNHGEFHFYFLRLTMPRCWNGLIATVEKIREGNIVRLRVSTPSLQSKERLRISIYLNESPTFFRSKRILPKERTTDIILITLHCTFSSRKIACRTRVVVFLLSSSFSQWKRGFTNCEIRCIQWERVFAYVLSFKKF